MVTGRRGRDMGLWVRVVSAGLLGVGATWVAPTGADADQVRDDQWHLGYLNVAEAHEISQGEGITVAVIDTGVLSDHPDLAGNVLPGADVVAGGNGDGWGDLSGHGTGMAGLIAAHGHSAGNADGALGIAPRARILPLRMQTTSDADGGVGGGDAMAIAVDEAVERGADIISISIGTDERAYDAIVGAVEEHGVVVVSAIGNRPEEPHPSDSSTWPGVVGVGAVGPDGLVADVSARGGPMRRITLTAPGVDIVSPSNSGRYRIGTGTSNSAAIVAGAAALVWSEHPDLTNVEVVDHLIATSTDKGAPGRDDEYGYGDLDLLNALQTEPTTTTTTTLPEGNGLPPRSNSTTTVPSPEEASVAKTTAADEESGAAGLGIALAAGVLVGTAAFALVLRRRRLASPRHR